MVNYKFFLTLFILFLSHICSAQVTKEWVLANYTKREVMIPMRDGVKLFTAIYEPKEEGQQAKDKGQKAPSPEGGFCRRAKCSGGRGFPILVERSPYTCAPYGEEFGRYLWTSMAIYAQHKYILVFQDVRGKNYSEGDFEDVKPLYSKQKKISHLGEMSAPLAPEHREDGQRGASEATDTYDTVDWLIKNVKNNNGNVGFWGISYPGFYSTMAGICGHPAVKAVSPQAPVTDWWLGDDMHHNGAFMLMDTYGFFPWFSRHNIMEPMDSLYNIKRQLRPGDAYEAYLEAGAISNLTQRLDSCPIWDDLCAHPDYDEWWQARDARNGINISSHKRGGQEGSPAVMVVGGEFDAEDCWGALHTYAAFKEKEESLKSKVKSKKSSHLGEVSEGRRGASNSSLRGGREGVSSSHFVFGPWTHGSWSRGYCSSLGDIVFGDSICNKNYMRDIEYPFFAYYLEGKGKKPEPVRVFSTGENKWNTFSEWPTKKAEQTAIYLSDNGRLSYNNEGNEGADSYVSTPKHPVPYQAEPSESRTTTYLCADQRYASYRPDVLTFQTQALTDTLRIAGPIDVDLNVSISTTDADFVVKVIDVFPDDFEYSDHDKALLAAHNGNNNLLPSGRSGGGCMRGYQMLVRGDIMRGRYRESWSEPKAFIPNAVTPVHFTLPDACHTFLPGHRLMIQVQSSWFPLVDMNPQQFVNIYTCKDSDFVDSNITIYHNQQYPSKVTLPVLR